MALMAVTVVGIVLSSTYIALSEPQDVRSRAAEPTTPPVITSLSVGKANSSATPTTEKKQPLLGGLDKVVKQTAEPSTASADISALSGSNITGVRFIYTLLGLGILIGGGAIGLILIVKKVLGT